MGMREPTYFLLAGLLDGPRHGYAIAQLARELSDGRVGLSAGTLYGALERLSDQGLIRPVEDLRVGGRRRRVYDLTEEGRTQLLEEAQRLREAADIVTARSALARVARPRSIGSPRRSPGGPRSASRAGDAGGPGAGRRPGGVLARLADDGRRAAVVRARDDRLGDPDERGAGGRVGAAAAAGRPERAPRGAARAVARAGRLRRRVGRHDGGDPAAPPARALSFPLLLALAFVSGVPWAASFGSQSAMVSGLLGDDVRRVAGANALLQTLTRLTYFVGPAIGGAVLATLGAPAVLWLDAASFLVSLLIVLFVVPPVGPGAGEPGRQPACGLAGSCAATAGCGLSPPPRRSARAPSPR
jgi:DNA-binding PadR family transcriptional regulator